MGSVSLVLNLVAEEIEFLPRVLASVKDFADEIILVDMSGRQEVKKIAKDFGAKVYPHEFVNYVEPARNFGISKATKEWVLILDPDEEVPQSLVAKLKSILKKPQADYYRLPRKNIVFEKWLRHSRWWPDYNIKFFKKGFVTWNELIHTVPMTTGKGIDLPSEESFAVIHHHYSSIEQYLERMNRYTSIQAELKAKEGYKFSWLDLVRKPVSEFLSRFFAGVGYKDGLHGLALAILQAFSEFVVYLKLWQKADFSDHRIDLGELKSEVRKVRGDTNYWLADAGYKETKNVVELVKRKLRLL